MELIQGGKFLRNGVPAFNGQRVEVTFTIRALPSHSFILSGKVIKVHPAPSPMSGIRPMKNCEDRGPGKGSMHLSGMLVPWIPCPICCGNNCDGATVNYSKVRWGEFCEACGGLHGDNWEQAPDQVKKDAFKNMVMWNAIFHGQEIDCAVRLNFSWDQKRGTEEGPWNDDIPFDGRDVWQLTLVADDLKVNVWQFKPGSLINLGRESFPRCWPWSNETELPYERDGVDRFNASGLFLPCLCLAPFGCDLHPTGEHEA